MTNPIHAEFDGIESLSKALQSGQVSAKEVANSALKHLDKHENLNAFLHINPKLTLQQAEAADALIKQGKAGPLTGIPIAHKDVLVTKGWRTTAASKMLANYVSPFDATVVQKLQQNGAVSLGKLNCDEFAMGSGSEYSAFGSVKNPWNPEYIPGGSSGGSAAAVASSLVMSATATDTGGSIRQPASMCGVSGIKPTYGTVSRYGVIALGSSLEQAGPMARSAKDLVLMLDAMSGFDELDSTSLQNCDTEPNKPGRVQKQFINIQQQLANNSDKPMQGLRVGIPSEFFDANLCSDTAEQVNNAIKQFEELGATLVEINLPHTNHLVATYYVLSCAEASTNLSRYDGVHFGYRAPEYTDLQSLISKSRSQGFGPEVKRRILLGTYALSHGYYDAYYLKAQSMRRLISDDFRIALEDKCDLIAGPVAPNAARKIGESSNTQDWQSDIFTVGANLAGLPALSIPCGFTSTGNLPIGLQLIGNYFAEGQLLAIADCYQNVTNWHNRKPETQ